MTPEGVENIIGSNYVLMKNIKIVKAITNRDSYSIDKYLRDISKVKLLVIEEELELVQRIRRGDEDAVKRLVLANLRFVVSVAKQYQNDFCDLNDLINEGNVGLIKAAHKFDPTRGFKFISYAVWWIRQSITQFLAENARIVRLPLNRVGKISKVRQAYDSLEQKFGREPSPEEIATVVEFSQEEVIDTLLLGSKHISLDAQLGEDTDRTRYDILPDTNSKSPDVDLDDESLNRSLLSLMEEALTPREREMIKLLFGIGLDLPMSLEDIGKKFDMTRERVRQIKGRALQKLRTRPYVKIVRQYLCQ